MSLELKLSRTAINETGTEMYLSDVTGDYAADNEGGWGAPNEERATRALLFEAYYKKSSGDVTAEISEYDPETVEHISVSTEFDGYYEILVASVEKVAPTVEGSYGWTVLGGLQKFEDGVLRAATVRELYDDPLMLESTSFKTITLGQTAIKRNRALLEYIKVKKQHDADFGHNRDLEDARDSYQHLQVMLEGARLHWCMDNYTEAQSVVEPLNES